MWNKLVSVFKPVILLEKGLSQEDANVALGKEDTYWCDDLTFANSSSSHHCSTITGVSRGGVLDFGAKVSQAVSLERILAKQEFLGSTAVTGGPGKNKQRAEERV